MTTAQQLADAALLLAQQFLGANRGELLALAGSDREALIKAAQLVRTKQPGSAELDRAAEHIAFTLLSEAFAEMTGKKGKAGSSRAAGP